MTTYLTPYNRSAALTIATPDGQGQAMHPSVIDFLTQHGVATWNGYRYWMAMTPYTASNDAVENPCLVASSDGLTWVQPAGITNPLDATPAGGYNADTELVYDAANDRLLVYYLGYDGTNKTICVRTVSNALAVGAETVLSSTVVASENDVSPCVIKDGDTWKMWTVEQVANPNVLRLRTSTDPLSGWSAPAACTFNRATNRDLWHMAIWKDATGVYRGLFTDCEQNVNGGTDNDIYLASSLDGTAWTMGTVPVIRDSPSGWDSGRLYRASGYIQDDVLRCWYSASTGATGGNWGTGYCEIAAERFPVV